MIASLDLTPFVDNLGLLSSNGSQSSNGILYNSELVILLDHLGDPAEPYLSFLVKESDSGLPGLIRRSSQNTDLESFSDYIGYCAVHREMAYRVYRYGIDHYWVFNNVKPGGFSWKAWLGRSPAFVAHVKASAGLRLGLLSQLAWCFTVLCAGISRDSWILSGLMCLGARRKSWLMSWASKVYQTRLNRRFGDLGTVFGAYFGNPNHPLAKNWKGFDYVSEGKTY